MTAPKLTPPPPSGNGLLDRWLNLLWRKLTAAGEILWGQIDTTGTADFDGNVTVAGNTTLGDSTSSDSTTINGVTSITANSSTAALRVTQVGSGNALVVEDETNPDSTPFVVTTDGNVTTYGLVSADGGFFTTFSNAENIATAGTTAAGSSLAIQNTVTSTAAAHLVLSGTISPSGTTQASVCNVSSELAPGGASLSNFFGMVFDPNLTNTIAPTNWTNALYRGRFGAASGGTVTTYINCSIATPIVTSGSTATIANYYGVSVADTSLTHTLAAGVRSVLSIGSGKFNFLASGTADNQFGGKHTVGALARIAVAAFSTTSPSNFYSSSATVTDGATSASGTVAHGTINSFDNPAIAASNANVAYTNASTVYIDGPPTSGTNVTITNPYSLYVNTGVSYFGGIIAGGQSSVAINTVLTDSTRSVLVTATARTITLPAASTARIGGTWTVMLGVTGYVDITRAGSDTINLPTNDTTIRLRNKGASVSLRCTSATSWSIV